MTAKPSRRRTRLLKSQRELCQAYAEHLMQIIRKARNK